MNKKIITLIVICMFLVLFSYLLFRPRVLKSNLQKSSTLTQSPSSTPTPSEAPYSVKVASVSRVSDSPQGIDYKAEIKNISVKPFITGFAFFECEFVDNNGKEYMGQLFNDDGPAFSKAILPGKSQSLTRKVGMVELLGYSRTLDGFSKCDYQQDGTKTCSIVKDLSVKSCKAYVTSDGKQVSNGWGKYPIEIQFPN